MKLSRKQIKEGLEQVPIEAVLLGASNKAGVKLTHREKRFCEELVKGETKSGAYRKAYTANGKSSTVAREANKVAKRPHVVTYKETLQAAHEAQRFTTPADLRVMTIQQLRQHALDESFPPAQRVKCLELLGKITEVSLFTERREIIKTDNSTAAREKLISSIVEAIKLDKLDSKTIDGDELLLELKRAKAETAEDVEATAEENAETETPPHPAPPSSDNARDQPLHSNPHFQSAPDTNPSENLLATQSVVFTEKDEQTEK